MSQRVFRLGERLFLGDIKAANVIPDIVLKRVPEVVVDAKYKGRLEDGREPGTCSEFERVSVRSRTVIAVEVEIRGISKEHGLAMFASNIAAWFRASSLA